jgi:hypothetical protein
MQARSGEAMHAASQRTAQKEAAPVLEVRRWRAWGALRRSGVYQRCKRWELWLCLAVGAWLRLADLRHTLFLNDQVLLLQMGQAALRDGGVPITGIPSSLGTLNAPFSVYLYLPFAALGSPLAATWMIALANLVALVLTYVVVDRAFGRLAAGATLALYATSAYAVFYSSYFWQQTAVAPFLLGYLLTLYAGVVQKRRRWLVPHLVLFGLLSQLHPITVYLLPTTLVGLALLWPRIPWRDLVVGLLGIGLLYVPTLIWGLVSNWADMQVLLRHFLVAPATYDLLALDQLLAVLRFQGLLPFGVSAAWLGWLVNGMYVLALGWLGWRVGAPLVRAFSAMKADSGVALWGLRENAAWRGELLLLVWQVAPLLLLIHRTQGYCQCYMVLFFPAPYITLGLALAWLIRRGGLLSPERGAFESLWTSHQGRSAFSGRGTLKGRFRGASPGACWRVGVLSSLVLLLALQTLSSSHLTLAYRGLDTEEASLSAGQREAQEIGAAQTIVASSLFLHGAFAYLAGHEPGAIEVQSAESCLALPPPASLPAVIVTALDQKKGMVDDVLGALPAATLLGTLPVRDLPPDHLYRVDGSTLRLADEQTLAQPVIADQHLALEGMAFLPESQGLIIVRWRVLQAYQEPAGPGAEPLSLLFRLQPAARSGIRSGAAATALCAPEHLEAGETLLTWFSFPGMPAVPAHDVPLANLSAHMVVSQRAEPMVGPLRFVTGRVRTKVLPPLPLLCLPDQPTQPSCPLALSSSSLG